MEGTMAVVTTVAYDFAPKYWALCNGTILSIAQNTALFSLLGTTFGGDGRTTFALPDLRGRVPVGTGTSTVAAHTVYTLGEVTGTQGVTLNVQNLPSHVHNGPVNVIPKCGYSADDSNSVGNYPGQVSAGYAPGVTANSFMPGPTVSSVTIGMAGGSQPVSLLTPFTALNYVICTQGIFPSRN